MSNSLSKIVIDSTAEYYIQISSLIEKSLFFIWTGKNLNHPKNSKSEVILRLND